MHNQIIISLILIIVCYISLQCFTIYVLKNAKKVRSGPALGERIHDLEVINVNQKKIKFSTLLDSQSKLILFVDMDCTHCKSIIQSLNLFNNNVLKNVEFFTVNSKENLEQLKQINTNQDFYLLSEEDMFEKLKVQFFPFYIEVDRNKIVQKKGYASNNTIIEYVI
ncbi:redoxin domain-containing protein [Priestia megaterium]|uniref:redoxin domain-containing protein n=1 Tax=Priestia megaterium TaxID=1404 RepID=UPI0025B02719|nr:redoxin domain-containing protein [Priestia megaterium]MDN3233548.1 redoxin domain-containing protein [Priestia megaterium]